MTIPILGVVFLANYTQSSTTRKDSYQEEIETTMNQGVLVLLFHRKYGNATIPEHELYMTSSKRSLTNNGIATTFTPRQLYPKYKR